MLTSILFSFILDRKEKFLISNAKELKGNEISCSKFSYHSSFWFLSNRCKAISNWSEILASCNYFNINFWFIAILALIYLISYRERQRLQVHHGPCQKKWAALQTTYFTLTRTISRYQPTWELSVTSLRRTKTYTRRFFFHLRVHLTLCQSLLTFCMSSKLSLKSQTIVQDIQT